VAIGSTGRKPMNDSVFLDTNILVYSYSFAELDKQGVARHLIDQHDSFISTQVLQELANTLIKKFKASPVEALNAVNESAGNCFVHINSESTIAAACKIVERYAFSFYDSLIIAAAIECGCTALFSEDLNHGQVIEEKLKIINPFL
jgi:predicted nucleic acid-binding protein